MTDQGDIDRMLRIGRKIESWGVEVRWMPGWEQRGATWAQVPMGVIDHHDAASIKSGEWGALGYIVQNGLAQFQVARCLDGKPRVAICAAGRQAHAGVGSWRFPNGWTVPTNNGNAYLYGVEKANDGRGEPYNDAAIYAADATFRAILEECNGLPFDHVIGHKEYGNRPPGGYPGRKTDPQYDMNWRRNRVANFSPQNGDDDMNDDQARQLAEVHSTLLRQFDYQGFDLNPADNTAHGLATRQEVAHLRREVGELRASLVDAVKQVGKEIREDVRADLAAGYGLKLEPKGGETSADPQ